MQQTKSQTNILYSSAKLHTLVLSDHLSIVYEHRIWMIQTLNWHECYRMNTKQIIHFILHSTTTLVIMLISQCT